ncbi:unnamed protein product [Xylocopa violacea]|uniref:Uncharacterized protein n=1 Tax=Xylocopa violacea TaxID=135666 RepID=A0ABP1NS92_XYLVO
MENEKVMSKMLTGATEYEVEKTREPDQQKLAERDALVTQSVDFPKRADQTFQELSERTSSEKEARRSRELKEESDSLETQVSNEKPATTAIDARAILPGFEKLEKTSGTASKLETVTVTTTREDTVKPDEIVTRETYVTEGLPAGFEDATRTTVSKVQRSVTDEVVSKETVVKTMTTVRCFATESSGMDRMQRTVRTFMSSGDYGDVPIPVVKQPQTRDPLPFSVEQFSTKTAKSTAEIAGSWAHSSLTDRSFLSDEKAEQWESQTFSQDTSPGSGNGDIYTKNGSSRHDLNSDTDSDGSPRSRRRSPSKRCTLGSSSGSDVALHEGAELSPLEDDQGTALTANLLSKQCTYPANQVTRETRSETENVNHAGFQFSFSFFFLLYAFIVLYASSACIRTVYRFCFDTGLWLRDTY